MPGGNEVKWNLTMMPKRSFFLEIPSDPVYHAIT